MTAKCVVTTSPQPLAACLDCFTLRLLQPSCSPSLVVVFGEFLDGLGTTGGVGLVTRRGKLWGIQRVTYAEMREGNRVIGTMFKNCSCS